MRALVRKNMKAVRIPLAIRRVEALDKCSVEHDVALEDTVPQDGGSHRNANNVTGRWFQLMIGCVTNVQFKQRLGVVVCNGYTV